MTGSDVNLATPPPDEPTKPPPPFEVHVTRLGGYHTTLVEVDWDGNKVWEYENRFQHHDFHRFANGNTLVPEWVELPEDLHRKVRGGYRMPREKMPRLIGDDLVEITPDFKEVRRINTWKLFDPLKDAIHPTNRRWEWTHINGIDVNAAGDIVFSARNCDRVAAIDHETGKLRFKLDKAHGQHNPTWLANGNVHDLRQRARQLARHRSRSGERRDGVELSRRPLAAVLQRPHLRRLAAGVRQRPGVRGHQRAPVRSDPPPGGGVGVDQPVREQQLARGADGEHLSRPPLRRRSPSAGRAATSTRRGSATSIS